MPIVHFYGRVFPENLKLTINNHPSLEWHDADIGDVTFHVLIQDGTIKISCDIKDFELNAHGTVLYDRALEVARATIDLAGFTLAAGLTVIFEQIRIESSEPIMLDFRQRWLAQHCTSLELGGRDFDNVYRLLIETPVLIFALHDLGLALTRRSHLSTYCARAIEALRDYFVPSGKNRKIGWKDLQSKLNLSEGYLKFISDHAVGPRHGSLVSISGDNSTAILERTWIIFNRFFEYRKRGNNPLPHDDFPIL